MNKRIVVEKHEDGKGRVFVGDTVLLESITSTGVILATSCSGTIAYNDGNWVFGPNCPNGIAVYKLYNEL